MPVLSVMNPTGHLTIEWDSESPESVKKAEAEFEALKKKGFRFWLVTAKGNRGEPIKKFREKDGRLWVEVDGVDVEPKGKAEVVAAGKMGGG